MALTRIGWEDLAVGIMVLGVPQVALTLGNAIIATVEENNTLFPDRRISVKEVAVDHGIMNLVGTSLGACRCATGRGDGRPRAIRRADRRRARHPWCPDPVYRPVPLDSVATLFKLFPGRFWA